jgi:hypothetical protein
MAAVLSLAIAARNAMPEGGRLVLAAEATPTIERSASACECARIVMISIDAYGYADVAGHHEQIFSDIDTALDFIGQCGGCLEICAASDERARGNPSTDMRYRCAMVSRQLS